MHEQFLSCWDDVINVIFNVDKYIYINVHVPIIHITSVEL